MPGEDPASRAARRQLLEHNIPMLLLGVGKARAAGTWTGDQVGCIVDVDDRVGRRLALATGGSLADADRFRGDKLTPTALLLVRARDLARFFKLEQPNIARQVLSPPPAGRVWVVVVGSGGAALAAVPDERVESVGEA